ncbi:HD domain-containing protein [uncultured Sphaerochaeta sp.]|uniref:HD domain-containing protein n=1 Tax=uncultured Sphaerochaeta sp. TaxID=886478 RepID=UPI003747C5B0
MNQDIMQSNLERLVETACASPNNQFGYGIWTHHIKPMISIAQNLAKNYGADIQIVTFATMLHDLAGIEDATKSEQHHIFGAQRAKEILSTYGYPQDKIAQVMSCILKHRGSIPLAPTSPEEICIADADAIAHMQDLGSLFFVAYVKKGMELEDGLSWVQQKLQRDWEKLSPRGKELYRETFETGLQLIGK